MFVGSMKVRLCLIWCVTDNVFLRSNHFFTSIFSTDEIIPLPFCSLGLGKITYFPFYWQAWFFFSEGFHETRIFFGRTWVNAWVLCRRWILPLHSTSSNNFFLVSSTAYPSKSVHSFLSILICGDFYFRFNAHLCLSPLTNHHIWLWTLSSWFSVMPFLGMLLTSIRRKPTLAQFSKLSFSDLRSGKRFGFNFPWKNSSYISKNSF